MSKFLNEGIMPPTTTRGHDNTLMFSSKAAELKMCPAWASHIFVSKEY